MKVLLNTILTFFMRMLLANWCDTIKCSTAQVVTEQPQQQRHIVMAVLLPVYNPSNYRYKKWPYFSQMLRPAMDIALDKVSSRILPGYNITYIPTDSECTLSIAQLRMLDLHYEDNCHVFFGPVCEYTAAGTARFSTHWNLPVISPAALSAGLSNKQGEYKSLTRLQGSYDKFGDALAKLFALKSWNLTMIVYDDSSLEIRDCYFAAGGAFVGLSRNRAKVTHIAINERNLDREMSTYLTKIQQQARSKY